MAKRCVCTVGVFLLFFSPSFPPSLSDGGRYCDSGGRAGFEGVRLRRADPQGSGNGQTFSALLHRMKTHTHTYTPTHTFVGASKDQGCF